MTRIVRKCAGSLAIAAGLLAFQACDNGVVEPPSLSGTWAYSVTNLNGSGLQCSANGVTITLTQSGTALTGSTSGGLVVCNSGSFPLPPSSITNGTVNGTNVTFGFSALGLSVQNTGTITGGDLSGTVSAQIPIGTATATLSGQFTATRQ